MPVSVGAAVVADFLEEDNGGETRLPGLQAGLRRRRGFAFDDPDSRTRNEGLVRGV